MKGPVILVANLLTEGRGMPGFTAADAVARIEEAIQRPVDVVITNTKWPSPKVLGRYALEHKEPLAPGELPATASWSAASSGPARSRGTIGCGSPTRSGACCRGGCSTDDCSPTTLRLRDAVIGLRVRATVAALSPLAVFACSALRGFVRGRCFAARSPSRPAFSFAARSMIVASIAPASPPLAGRFERQTAGVSSPRMSSKSPSLFTLRGANSVMSSSPAQSSRCLISSQLATVAAAAARARIAAAGPHEHPRSLQLVAVQRELQVALLQRRVDVVDFGRPRAAVPEHHDAGAVAFGNDALELAVLERMILDVHRQPLGLRIERRPLRHRPRQQHAVVLEPEVVVQVAGEMLLDAEEPLARLARLDDRAGRLGVFVKSRLRLYSSRAI